MTVREAVSVLKYAKEVGLVWDGKVILLEVENELMMEAYGDYRINSLYGVRKEKDECVVTRYELEVACGPIREDKE